MSKKKLTPAELISCAIGMVVCIAITMFININYLPRNIFVFMITGAIGGAVGSSLGFAFYNLIKKKNNPRT